MHRLTVTIRRNGVQKAANRGKQPRRTRGAAAYANARVQTRAASRAVSQNSVAGAVHGSVQACRNWNRTNGPTTTETEPERVELAKITEEWS